ncbi:MAG: biosynthetic-type acetolactate synthase large subunit [Opitutales bacterium]|nr:biosynthetic-type acetolactate synthase large subunit [Opitutales bacterium]
MQNSTSTQKIASSALEPIRGADLIVRCLEREGVDHVFAYPGGASMEIHQSLTRSTKIRTILPRHEQGAGFMAHGYARTTGKTGVCMVTSGPGATNLVTCIADAWMDSIPMVAITGQVAQHFIGKTAFQETDVFGMTLPICKHSYLVLKHEDLPRVIKEAFYVANSGRPGPVVIDIPKDVQQKVAAIDYENVEMNLPGYTPYLEAQDSELIEALNLISAAKRPVLYIGGGIISAKATEELKAFAEMTGIPVATTLMGVGAFPDNHPQSLRWFGMHGGVAGNWAVQESDLLVTLGARFDDRITGVVSKFAPNAKIVHIDLDKSEHHKNKIVDLPIHSDVKYAMTRMMALAKEHGFEKPQIDDWCKKVYAWREEYPFTYEASPYIQSQHAISELNRQVKGEAIITTGVGQHQMWSAQFCTFHRPRSFISSLGLGTMGFGLPSALGAKVACPDRTVVDIDGDGSFTMNVQELATAVRENIPVKIMLLNNQHLGMVMQWEDILYQGVRGNTVLCDPNNLGGPHNPSAIYPDWLTIAKGFGVKGRQVIKKEELSDAIAEMLAAEGPFLLEVVVPNDEHVMPFIPAGKSAKEILIKTPKE